MDKKYVFPENQFLGVPLLEFNDPICMKAEVIDSYTQANAKSLGKLAAFMANKGTLNGVELISKATWNEMMSEVKEEKEHVMVTRYTKGGFGVFKHSSNLGNLAETKLWVGNTALLEHCVSDNRDGWYGQWGYGGSLIMMYPELNIGFSYVPRDFTLFDFSKRGAVLQRLVLEAV